MCFFRIFISSFNLSTFQFCFSSVFLTIFANSLYSIHTTVYTLYILLYIRKYTKAYTLYNICIVWLIQYDKHNGTMQLIRYWVLQITIKDIIISRSQIIKIWIGHGYVKYICSLFYKPLMLECCIKTWFCFKTWELNISFSKIQQWTKWFCQITIYSKTSVNGHLCRTVNILVPSSVILSL